MNNNTDPLTVLHGDELPVQPDPAFAARLRARLARVATNFRAERVEPQPAFTRPRLCARLARVATDFRGFARSAARRCRFPAMTSPSGGPVHFRESLRRCPVPKA